MTISQRFHLESEILQPRTIGHSIWWLANLGTLPKDDDKERVKKAVLTLVSGIIAILAIFWGSFYVFLGFPYTGLIPLSYSIISFLSIGYFFATKKFVFFRTSQLLLILFLPFLCQWSLGGFANGSVVMVWAFFAPLAAMLFADLTHARSWLLAFLALTLISGMFDATFATHADVMSQSANVIFFVMNMGFGFISIFFVLNSFVRDRENSHQAVLKAYAEKENVLERLHETNLRLEAANNSKSVFVTNMSHEIRTPLTAINGFGETLLDHDISLPERLEAANAIVRNGTHLLHIINDILDMSKIEAGKLHVECISFPLFEFMADIDSFISKQATDKGLDFSVDYQFPLPRKITTDPLRLKQILLNLGSNAIKFTAKGSIKIIVSCTRNPNTISFEFIDTGVGLTDAQQMKLFSPFTQADSSTTRRYGGTGLGLHLSKTLAELLGGTITLDSEPGVGSKFKVVIDYGHIDQSEFVNEFPRLVKKPTLATPLADLSPLGGRVLLADDNPDNQRLISLFVRKMNLALSVVENGEQAVQHASSEDFDVILMDMQMPVMDGLTAVKILRAKNYTKPIIALTANVMKRDCELYAAAGCNDYIAKPLSRDWLYKVLIRYLPMNTTTATPIHSLVLVEEPEVEDIVQRFVQGLHVIQEKIHRGMHEENWTELKHILHDIKGTGSSMGYPMLTELAQKMEQHLSHKEYREMGECCVHFDIMCNRIYAGSKKAEHSSNT